MEMLDKSLRERVWAVLLGKLGPDGAARLGEVADDARTREIVGEAIRREFPYLRPPWRDTDLGPASTLDSITLEIDRRRRTSPAVRRRR